MPATLALPEDGAFRGRIWRPGVGPAIVTLRGGQLYDIASCDTPTIRWRCRPNVPPGNLARAP